MATKNLVGNPNGILENEVNTSVAKSGFGQGISPSHFFTMNEGEIKLQYDELLEPNSEIKIKNQWLAWQSPLVSRNLTNQRVRTHYIAQSIKNMWADYRSYMFGGRYGDFATPELHFHSHHGSSCAFLTSYKDSATDDYYSVAIRYRNISNGSPLQWQTVNLTLKPWYCLEGLKNAFLTYFANTSLGEALGFQTEEFFSDLNTPNPWPFMAYLNFYKWFVANKYLLRGDSKIKKIWFPDNEDDFKFHCGSGNKSTGVIGRFFSPEEGFRSGISFKALNLRISVEVDKDIGNPKLGYPVNAPIKSVTVTFNGKVINHYSGVTSSVSGEFECSPEVCELFNPLYYTSSQSTVFEGFTVSQWVKIFDFIKSDMFSFEGLSFSGVKHYFLDLFETRYMNFNKDYFTGGLISPLINGDYPQLNTIGSVTALEAETVLSGGSVNSTIDFQGAIYPGSDLSSGSNNYVRIENAQQAGGQFGVSDQGDDINDSQGTALLLSALNKASISNVLENPTATTTITGSASVSGGFSIPDLRLLSATTEYLEALARSDGDYRNMVLAIYGVKPTEVSEAPIYLGGSSGFVQTQNIFQTSPSSDSPLGSVTQTGFSGGSDYIGSYFAKDTTVVLGLVSIVPEIFYFQGVPKKWVMRHKEEHQNPKFNGLSMQAIENREIFVSGDDSVDTLPFAYAPAWEFMRHRQNRLSGLMKPHFSPENGVLMDKPFTQMVQTRNFASTPDFNTDFVSTKGNISTEHLYTQNVDIVPEFTFAIKNDVSEILPITKSGIPSKI